MAQLSYWPAWLDFELEASQTSSGYAEMYSDDDGESESTFGPLAALLTTSSSTPQPTARTRLTPHTNDDYEDELKSAATTEREVLEEEESIICASIVKLNIVLPDSVSSVFKSIGDGVCGLRQYLPALISQNTTTTAAHNYCMDAKVHPTLGIPELLTHVLSFLTTVELLDASHSPALVCKLWHKCANHHSIWAQHCDALWRSKHTVPALCSQLRSKKKRRGKEAYLLSAADARRRSIHRSELVGASWHFVLKHEPAFMLSAIRGGKDWDPTIFASFDDESNVYFDTDHPWLSLHQYNWRFVSRKRPQHGSSIVHLESLAFLSAFSDSKADESEEESALGSPLDLLVESRLADPSSAYIQINQYPPLRVTREKDTWGFRLENHWVVFSTI